MAGHAVQFKLVPPSFTPDNPNLPKGRSGHSMCSNETDIFVFGGYSQADERNGLAENTVFPELWKFNFAQQTWTKLNVTGSQSTCLSSCMVLQSGKLFVFGGTGYPFAEEKDNSLRILELPKSLFKRTNMSSGDGYNTFENKWTLVETSPYVDEEEFADSIPPPDYGQSMILNKNCIYIYGGTAGFYLDDAIAELFCLSMDTRKWVKLKPTGTPPCGRYKQEVVQDSEHFYVLGGGRLQHSEGLDQIYRYSFSQNHWSSVTSLPDPVQGFPKSRCCFGCAKEQDNVYISGGRHYIAINAFQELADIWHLKLSTLQWTRLSFYLPEKMFFHRTIVAPSGLMYMFGGVLEDGLRSANLYKLRLPFSIGRLTELCWEKVCELLNNNKKLSYDVLVSQGIPWNFIERISPIPA